MLASAAVKSDGEIVFGQAKFRCDLGKLASIEINALKQLPVLLRHVGEQPFEALAKQPLVWRARTIRHQNQLPPAAATAAQPEPAH